MRIDRLTSGAALVGMAVGLAVLADFVSPQDPIRQELSFALDPPGAYHPLGTDRLGRDVLARLAHGARVTLVVAGLGTALAALLGAAVGLAAAVSGTRTGGVLMRGVDAALAFPTLALLLVLASLHRCDSVASLVLLIGATTWMPIARLVRAEAVSAARRRYVEAAVGLGAGPLRRAVRHLLPNVASTAIVAATLQVGDAMLIESGLSYLGLGVAAPTPTWGDMVRAGTQDLGAAWWIALFPGLALAGAVVGVNLMGDGLRDALQPGLSAVLPGPGRRPAPGWGVQAADPRSTP
ncbi:MAG TPA: ABC transporter permease [Candidatus Polarisedimenticolia bacterium]|nr:ABC transporter permease [Candidatus Polarisedimenticolia bacterium]